MPGCEAEVSSKTFRHRFSKQQYHALKTRNKKQQTSLIPLKVQMPLYNSVIACTVILGHLSMIFFTSSDKSLALNGDLQRNRREQKYRNQLASREIRCLHECDPEVHTCCACRCYILPVAKYIHLCVSEPRV